MGKGPLSCGCERLPFADLPPEWRPKAEKKGSLRQEICPLCGKEYWTNREIDLCFECEKSQRGSAAE